MLKLISDRLQSHVHDDMLEIAWSAMWNVTDETPVNCLRFLNGEGMTYFQKCLKVILAVMIFYYCHNNLLVTYIISCHWYNVVSLHQLLCFFDKYIATSLILTLCSMSKCLQEFPDKPELLRNMMGLLGNVAEVKELRHRLMTPDLLTTFADLLDSNSDGIEVSHKDDNFFSRYNITGSDKLFLTFLESVKCAS